MNETNFSYLLFTTGTGRRRLRQTAVIRHCCRTVAAQRHDSNQSRGWQHPPAGGADITTRSARIWRGQGRPSAAVRRVLPPQLYPVPRLSIEQSARVVPMYFITSVDAINPATQSAGGPQWYRHRQLPPVRAGQQLEQPLNAAVSGMTDRAVQVGTRDGSLNANPIGTPPRVHKRYPEFSWTRTTRGRYGSSLTLNLGIEPEFQAPPD